MKFDENAQKQVKNHQYRSKSKIPPPKKQKNEILDFFKLEIGPGFDWIRLWSRQKYQEKAENPKILIILIRGVVKSY